MGRARAIAPPLADRHALARTASSVDEAAARVVALHSSDPATVYLSAWARVRSFLPADLEDALYEQRSLVRMLGMRRTLWVVPTSFAPVVLAATTTTYAGPERRRVLRLLAESGVSTRPARWLERVASETLEALRAHGSSTARELTREVPQLGHRFAFGEGKRWAGTMGLSTRLLFLLAAEGRVLRARPLGSWTSGQYRWARVEDWLGAPFVEIDPGEARAELLRRYLLAFGPASMTDVRWWTGWTKRTATSALDAIGAEEVTLANGRSGYATPEGGSPTRFGRWAALLPSLDPTTMGWKDRGWYLGGRGVELFDRAGNAGPTIWVNDRVVGGWQQRADGAIALAYLERVDARTRALVDAEAERLRSWLGEVRIKPRFPTPFHARLSRD